MVEIKVSLCIYIMDMGGKSTRTTLLNIIPNNSQNVSLYLHISVLLTPRQGHVSLQQKKTKTENHNQSNTE